MLHGRATGPSDGIWPARTEYRAQVEQHLQVCAECREEFAALLTAEGLEADLP